MTYHELLRLYLSNSDPDRIESEIIPFKLTRYSFGESPFVVMESMKGSIRVIWRDTTILRILVKSSQKEIFFSYYADGKSNMDECAVYIHDAILCTDPYGRDFWMIVAEGEAVDIDSEVPEDIWVAAEAPFTNTEP